MRSRQLPRSSALARACLPVQSWSSPPARFHPSLIWPWLPAEPSGSGSPSVVPEAPVGMALFSDPIARSSFPRPKGSSWFSLPCCPPGVLLSRCHMCVHRVATAIVVLPDFHGFPQLPVNRNPGQREDSCCCSSGRPWDEKCPPAAQPRVWPPGCLSFAGRAGTVGALSSATAWRRAVGAGLEPPACRRAVVTAAAAALAE